MRKLVFGLSFLAMLGVAAPASADCIYDMRMAWKVIELAKPGEWLHGRPAIAWGLLAVIWWAMLSPSVVGLVLLAVAVAQAVPLRVGPAAADAIILDE